MNGKAWHIITGEYPPAPGGVSDYTAILARAMAATGAEVHVWTGAPDAGANSSGAVTVHRISDAWSETGLRELNAALDAQPSPRILLVQYVPNAWGRRGMNVAFCHWVRERRYVGDEVRLMIHEPFLPYQMSLGPARWYMAWVQRRMMTLLLDAASTVYLSATAWQSMIRRYQTKRDQQVVWLPVFSNIPVVHDPEGVRDLRSEIANPHQLIVGSFGTYGGAIGRVTGDVFAQLLPEFRDAVGLLLGRGSVELAAQVLSRTGVPPTRLFAFEDLPAEEISLRLQGCDLMVQPYPGGINSRRSSAMAGMAHCLPIVTNHGALTDPVFREEGGVAGLGKFDAAELAFLAHGFLLAEDSRDSFGQWARGIYEKHFAVERTVEKLLSREHAERVDETNLG